ncbi:MAG TPA: hypothetical protein VK545_15475 [Streptomyces sp.]|nr:hypothetical protein [Streptomyces sp.]
MTRCDDGWAGIGWDGWKDLEEVRRRLDEGADPEKRLFVTVRHAGAALLRYVDPRLGLRGDDFRALEDFGHAWARSGRRP